MWLDRLVFFSFSLFLFSFFLEKLCSSNRYPLVFLVDPCIRENIHHSFGVVSKKKVVVDGYVELRNVRVQGGGSSIRTPWILAFK